MGLRDLADLVGLKISDAPRPIPQRPAGKPEPKNQRVRDLPSMVGQDRARVMLRVQIQGARARGQHPGHILLFGPPGLGKTTLAEIVAYETGGCLHRTIGSQLDTVDVLAQTLSLLSRKTVDVLFIDEVHALPKKVMELLYLAMEDGRIELKVGRGTDAVIKSVQLPEFILVGATTLPGWLTQPFRDRFQTKLSLEYYTPEQLTRIIRDRAAGKRVLLDEPAAVMLGHRSRGTPRIAIARFDATANYAAVVADGIVTVPVVDDAMELEGVDSLGLDADDRALLHALCVRFKGQPIGVQNLAATLGHDEKTLTGQLEPYLIREGLITRTRRGRKAMEKAYKHLGLEPPFHFDEDAAGVGAGWEERS